jgi:hypothetical protein
VVSAGVKRHPVLPGGSRQLSASGNIGKPGEREGKGDPGKGLEGTEELRGLGCSSNLPSKHESLTSNPSTIYNIHMYVYVVFFLIKAGEGSVV